LAQASIQLRMEDLQNLMQGMIQYVCRASPTFQLLRWGPPELPPFAVSTCINTRGQSPCLHVSSYQKDARASHNDECVGKRNEPRWRSKYPIFCRRRITPSEVCVDNGKCVREVRKPSGSSVACDWLTNTPFHHKRSSPMSVHLLKLLHGKEICSALEGLRLFTNELQTSWTKISKRTRQPRRL